MSGNRVLRRCVGVTRRGEACRGRAMKESDWCVAQRWETPPPTPSADARKRRTGEAVESEEAGTDRSMVVVQAEPVKELQTIEDVVEDMLQRQSQLTTLIEEKTLAEPLNVSEMAKLLTLHGQNGSRIGRRRRDQRAVGGARGGGCGGALVR